MPADRLHGRSVTESCLEEGRGGRRVRTVHTECTPFLHALLGTLIIMATFNGDRGKPQ